MILALILVSTAISLIEGIPLIQKKQRKEFTVLIAIIMISIFLVMLKGLGVSTPIEILGNLLTPLGKHIYRFQ